MAKASLPWYRNLTVYYVMHLKLKQMHKCIFFFFFFFFFFYFVQNARLKGSYLCANIDSHPLFV